MGLLDNREVRDSGPTVVTPVARSANNPDLGSTAIGVGVGVGTGATGGPGSGVLGGTIGGITGLGKTGVLPSGTGSVVSGPTTVSTSTYSCDTQQLSQIFCRFLFQQLHREADLAILAKNRAAYNVTQNLQLSAKDAAQLKSIQSQLKNTIDNVFSYAIATTTTFLQSGTIELGTANKVFRLFITLVHTYYFASC